MERNCFAIKCRSSYRSRIAGGTVKTVVFFDCSFNSCVYCTDNNRQKKNWFMVSKKGFIIGAVSSFLLQGLHEMLHGIAFPTGSTVYIGIIKGNFSGYATSTDPMNIIQCVVYYLLPAFVLGIVPLLGFVLDKEKKSTFCWFCYGFALIGLVQTAPDWFGLFPILRQVPRNAIIQMSGWHTYWYLK